MSPPTGDVTGGVMIVPSDPTLRSVLARALQRHPGMHLDPTSRANQLITDPALAAAERVLAAAVEWERGRLDDTEAFVTLVEAVHAYRSVVEGR